MPSKSFIDQIPWGFIFTLFLIMGCFLAPIVSSWKQAFFLAAFIVVVTGVALWSMADE